jgi:hypothetical protein
LCSLQADCLLGDVGAEAELVVQAGNDLYDPVPLLEAGLGRLDGPLHIILAGAALTGALRRGAVGRELEVTVADTQQLEDGLIGLFRRPRVEAADTAVVEPQATVTGDAGDVQLACLGGGGQEVEHFDETGGLKRAFE